MAMPKRPQDGSRKATVFDVFFEKGADAAIAKAKELGLGSGTAPSWVKEWARASGKPLPVSPPKTSKKTGKPPTPREKPAKITRERLPDDHGERFNPVFKYTTTEQAEQAVIETARRSGLRPWTYHVIEHNKRFAIAPAHYKAKGPIPQFDKGDLVYDCYLVNSEAKVIDAGPEQCVVRYVLPYKNRPPEACVPNRYLIKFDGVPSVVPKPRIDHSKTSSTHSLKVAELKIRKTKKEDKPAPKKGKAPTRERLNGKKER